jgi:hypothetical protein
MKSPLLALAASLCLLAATPAARAQQFGSANANRIRGRYVDTCVPSNGQVYGWSDALQKFICAPGTGGTVGATGPAGANGSTVLNGSGAPSNGTGADGDFYLDTTAAHALYGPKAAGVWGGSVSLVGPAGATGATGPAGADGHSDLPAVGKLQYFRGNPATAAIEAVALTSISSTDYNFAAQAPGGTIAAGSNTIAMAPCPLGVAGANLNHYVRLSAGTGSAEAALITGGTCTSGAGSGTIIVTAANGHSGAWTVTSATAGIREAIKALGATGGTVFIPAGTHNLYATVHLGNGSLSAASSENSIEILGAGIGSANTEDGIIAGATRLNWLGAAGGTMMQINGPISGLHIEGIKFLCNDTANIGLKAIHAYHSTFKRLQITGFATIGIIHTAYSNPSGVAIGANENLWEQIYLVAGANNAIGWQMGEADIGSAPFLNVAGNTFIQVQIQLTGANTYAMELRFVDHLSFLHCQLTGAHGLKLSKTPSSAGFPGVIWMFLPIVQDVVSDVALDDGTPLTMFGFALGDGETIPVGVKAASGIGTDGKTFGRPIKGIPLLYSAVTSSSAVANTASLTTFSKTFDVPAYLLQGGAVLRVKTGGIYSTTGAPTFTVQVRVGGTVLNQWTDLPTQNNAGDYSWSVQAEATVRSSPAQASALIQRGMGVATTTAVLPSDSPVQSFILDTTIAETVDVRVQWSAASAGNTITLTSLDVEVLQPNIFN